MQNYAYLTHDDFKHLSKQYKTEEKGNTMIIITAPKGTKVEAPNLESNKHELYPYQLYMDCKNVPGQIEVYVCTDENHLQEQWISSPHSHNNY